MEVLFRVRVSYDMLQLVEGPGMSDPRCIVRYYSDNEKGAGFLRQQVPNSRIPQTILVGFRYSGSRVRVES